MSDLIMSDEELAQLKRDATVTGRTTFSYPEGGFLKRRVMRRVREAVNELEKLGWVAPPSHEWQIKGIARIAVVVVLTKGAQCSSNL